MAEPDGGNRDGTLVSMYLRRRARLPPYFGHNWDALHDALTDPSWLPPSGFVLRLRGWDRFAAARPDDAATLREVVEGAGRGAGG